VNPKPLFWDLSNESVLLRHHSYYGQGLSATGLNQDKKMNWGAKLVVAMALFMAFILSLSILMMVNKPEMAEDNYYEKDLRYEHWQQVRQQSEGLTKQISLEYDSHLLILHYPPQMQQAKGKLVFKRPSAAAEDFELDLQYTNGEQVVETARLSRGLWQLHLEGSLKGKAFESQVWEVILSSATEKTQVLAY
jgi:nitrogen fixation protein FixH